MQDWKILWLKRDCSGLSHHQLMHGDDIIGIIKRIADAEAIIHAVNCHNELVELGQGYIASILQTDGKDETARMKAMLAMEKIARMKNIASNSELL